MSERAQRGAAVFAVGAPRSGTTLLRLMLDAHPDLAIPPETGFIPAACALRGQGAELRQAFLDLVIDFPPGLSAWADFRLKPADLAAVLEATNPCDVAEAIRAFYRLYAQRFGKSRWGDKTPAYCHHLLQIEALLPEAKFVHLIRDGRDVAVSLRRMWFAPDRAMSALASRWVADVKAARGQGRKARSYLEVRFEDLIRQPELELKRICEFVDLPFHSAMLEYQKTAGERLDEHQGRTNRDGAVVLSREERHAQQRSARSPLEPARIGVWRGQLTPAEAEEFATCAGELLDELGYR